MRHPIQNVKPVNQKSQPEAPQGDGVREVYRFNAQSLAALEKQLPRAGVDNDTTPLKAGMLLGIQMVLDKLRNGFTV